MSNIQNVIFSKKNFFLRNYGVCVEGIGKGESEGRELREEAK